MKRRSWFVGAAALASCKRSVLAPIRVWDDPDATGIDAQGADGLALRPAAPQVTQLGRHAPLHWLQEPGSHRTRLRLMLSLPREGTGAAAQQAIALADEFRRDVRPHGGFVDVMHRAGRVEVLLVLPAEHTDATIAAMALRFADPERGQAARAAPADTKPADLALERALGALVTVRPRGESVFDPGYGALIVHAPSALEAHTDPLAQLAEGWALHASTRSSDRSLIERFRVWDPRAVGAQAKAGSAKMRLRARHLQPLDLVARARLQLAQRIIQEEHDVRLVLRGNVAIAAAPGTTAGLDATREAIAQTWGAGVPKQRLDTAARLWLGARTVQASLAYEDWTGPYADGIDFVDHDPQLPGANAQIARVMLSATSDDVARWGHALAPDVGPPWVEVDGAPA